MEEYNKKLKLCPFCGGQAAIHIEDGQWHGWYAQCERCGVRTQRRLFIDYAVEEWNQRVKEAD